jgi:hypothetical protein
MEMTDSDKHYVSTCNQVLITTVKSVSVWTPAFIFNMLHLRSNTVTACTIKLFTVVINTLKKH